MNEYVVDFGDDAKSAVRIAMAEQHGADVRGEIVRCRDCKEYRESDCTCHSWQWHNWDAPIEVDPDGFCAWGEKRDA